MKKKILAAGLIVALFCSLFSMSVSASARAFYFNVKPSVNNGVAWSGPNAKDDNEQAAYVHTQDSNITPIDAFYYIVRRTPRVDGFAMCPYRRVTTKISNDYMPYYGTAAVGAGYYLYLEADTDSYGVWTDGYWYS